MNSFLKKKLRLVLFSHRKFIYGKDWLRGELERFLLSYTVLLVALLCCVAFIVVHICKEKKYSLFVDLSILALLVITYLLLTKGKMWQAKVLGTIVSNLFIVFNASLEGRASGYQFIFFPIVIGVLMVFNLQERKITHLCLLFTLSCITFLEMTDYSILMTHKASNDSIKLNTMISLLFSVALVYVYVSHIIKSNSISFMKLKKLNIVLGNQKENLEKVNMELDIFVYKASHDLKAPLSSMLGLIALMKFEKDIIKMQQYLIYQEKSIHKLDSYIISILNISRNARMDIAVNEIDLKTLFTDTCAQFNYMPAYANIEKKINVIQEMPFYSDVVRISVILNNLISNSIRYIDLKKTNHYMKITAEVTAKEAVISIYDNGVGIKSAYTDKIYNMFFRATESASGSGLGLYIVKETLAKLNGTIQVDSQYGSYTEFKICIPNRMTIPAPKE